jgi:hypothetical protein
VRSRQSKLVEIKQKSSKSGDSRTLLTDCFLFHSATRDCVRLAAVWQPLQNNRQEECLRGERDSEFRK